jgi:hypothetical protein
MSECLREQQFHQTIIELLGVQLQDILQEIKKQTDEVRRSTFSPAKLSKNGRRAPPNFIRDATSPEKTNQTQHVPTSETLKPRRDISELIIDADAVKPKPRVRLTAKYHHCRLQHISPPDSLCWTLYKEIEGELAAAQYTRTEIREYIRDLQSHYKPSPAEPSTKGPPIPEESYIIAPKDCAKPNPPRRINRTHGRQGRDTKRSAPSTDHLRVPSPAHRDPAIHHPPTLPPHHGELLPLVCRTRMSQDRR